MGKTIEELFRTKILDNGQTAETKYEIRNSKDLEINTANPILNSTAFPIVQKLRNSKQLTARLDENLFEQELVGLRTLQRVSSPIIYGADIIRLSTKTTNIKNTMADAAAGGLGDNGIIGNAINQVKDKALEITSKLGIAFPETMIPTKVSQNEKFILGKEPDTMITLAQIKNDSRGNLVGKLLKDSVKGTPKQISNAIIGNTIQLVKDNVRKKLFGSRKTGTQNLAEQNAGEPTLYDSGLTYSSTIDPFNENIEGRNDLSSILNSKNEIDKNIQSGGDFLIKSNTPPSVNEYDDKINTQITRNAFASKRDRLKTIEPVTRKRLAGGRKDGQRQLSELDNKNSVGKNTYTDERYYTDTVDATTDDVVLRNDLSTKLSSLENALNNVTDGGVNQGVPNRADVKLYSTLKNENRTSINVARGMSNVGDVINQKMPFDGESLSLGDKKLDEYDFIPLKFYSYYSKKTVQFRATISGLSETVSPTWDAGKFLGSPFKHYTYSGVERSLRFNFKIYSLNIAEHIIAWEKINFLTGLAYPVAYSTNSAYLVPPFIKFTLGDIYKNRECFIDSLNYSIEDNSTWEVGSVGLPENATVSINGKKAKVSDYKLPTIVNVDVALQLIESRGNTAYKYGFVPVNFVKRPSDVDTSVGTQVASIEPESLPSNSPISIGDADSRKIQKALPITQKPIKPNIGSIQPTPIINGEISPPSANESYNSRERTLTDDYIKELKDNRIID
jgi:hypothetical protein